MCWVPDLMRSAYNEKSKISSIFVTRYLEALSGEYMDHGEYNSFKHGLRGFPGKMKLQAVDEKTGQTVFDSHNDFNQNVAYYSKLAPSQIFYLLETVSYLMRLNSGTNNLL
jgi:hypothetical protein